MKTRFTPPWGSGNKIYRGVLTGCNEAFVIDAGTKQKLIELDRKSADLIRPLVVGDDVRRWHVRDKQRYLIVTYIGVPIKNYPAIFDHLSQWKEKLMRRSDQGNHWWELRSCDYYDAFDKPKIIYPDMSQTGRFTMDTQGVFFGNTVYMIPLEDYYLLGILNSKHFLDLCRQNFAVFKGSTLRFFKQDLLKMPIPLASPEIVREIADLTIFCLSRKGEGCNYQEERIDLLVKELYGL